ncbi:hypothetical protein R1flu_003049 [Riccia fluitans]|uniref:Uncharacterized protein n=1 Tax=Riccia fluitans TaxID=41844 RepID=A0ABD1Y7W3_9MARC
MNLSVLGMFAGAHAKVSQGRNAETPSLLSAPGNAGTKRCQGSGLRTWRKSMGTGKTAPWTRAVDPSKAIMNETGRLYEGRQNVNNRAGGNAIMARSCQARALAEIMIEGGTRAF